MKQLLQLWKKLPLSRAVRVFLLRRINDQFLIGVTGVIFNKHNHVLVLKHTYRKVAWSLPGGYLQQGEHPKAGLAREIEEETGFKVHILKIIKTTAQKDGRLDMSYFGVYESGKFKPSEEVIKHKFVPIDKLPKLIEDQYKQIEDGLYRKKQHDASHRWDKLRGAVPSFLKRITMAK